MQLLEIFKSWDLFNKQQINFLILKLDTLLSHLLVIDDAMEHFQDELVELNEHQQDCTEAFQGAIETLLHSKVELDLNM